MAEPVHSPATPRSREARLPAVEASTPLPIAGLHTLGVHHVPELPSLAALRALSDRDLPATDGLPMPESTIQLEPLSYTVNAVKRFLRHCPSVFVAGDLLIYHEGRPDATGKDLEHYDEVHDARDAAEARAAEEAAGRRAAEEKVADLEARIRLLRREPGR